MVVVHLVVGLRVVVVVLLSSRLKVVLVVLLSNRLAGSCTGPTL